MLTASSSPNIIKCLLSPRGNVALNVWTSSNMATLKGLRLLYGALSIDSNDSPRLL